MKPIHALFAASALACLPGIASAQAVACPCGAGTRIQQPGDVATLLGGKTVCAVLGSEVWQEFHAGATVAGGTLTDYKRGPGHPVDPSEAVGSWSVTGQGANTQIVYNYGTGGTFAYTVCQNGAAVNFCGARNITGATLRSGQVSCN